MQVKMVNFRTSQQIRALTSSIVRPSGSRFRLPVSGSAEVSWCESSTIPVGVILVDGQ